MSEDRALPPDRDQPGRPDDRTGRAADGPAQLRIARGPVEPRRLSPLVHRRPAPHLIVEVDGSPACHGALVWALREAARREGTVVAVSVQDEPALGARGVRVDHGAVLERLEAQVLRAIAETGVQGRARACVLERTVFEALTAASHGADLVMVGPDSKTLLRPAVPRPPIRPLARGA